MKFGGLRTAKPKMVQRKGYPSAEVEKRARAIAKSRPPRLLGLLRAIEVPISWKNRNVLYEATRQVAAAKDFPNQQRRFANRGSRAA